MPQVRQIDLD
ncbi:Protein of unknown function [Escherichia coli D6-117.29]|nr:Protein of unknown function [Escherichia coli D6-113.11]CDP75164.1 Protein of unknown function [Escherichia coli D6-117.29]CDU36341.1 Protein of unknown function [Escherichia coli D6-113.11]